MKLRFISQTINSQTKKHTSNDYYSLIRYAARGVCNALLYSLTNTNNLNNK